MESCAEDEMRGCGIWRSVLDGFHVGDWGLTNEASIRRRRVVAHSNY